MARSLVFAVALLGLPSGASAQEAAAPVFMAVSVADLDASVAWYARTLDLTATRLPERGPARAALLQGHGLVVEIIEHARAFDPASRVPELKDRYLGHGLFKVGFSVTDLDAAVERFRARGATFRGTAFTDPVLGARSILMLDNAGNVIQLFQRVVPG